MKIAFISSSKQYRESIYPLLQEDEPEHSVLLFEDGKDKLGMVADNELPDLIVMESAGDGHEAIAELEGIIQRHPGMYFIMLCEQVSAENLTQAMRLGVREVLPVPVSPHALKEAVARIRQNWMRTKKLQHKGKVLAFIACKGGSGSTFLAANLGYILAAELNKRVILIDLNLQFGDASLFVSDSIPANTLADVSHGISRLDASFLASSLVQVLPNYGVLAAPENPDKATDVSPTDIEAVLRLAVAEYDYVVLDAGRNLNPVNIKALDYADLIFPVLQETLPFIRDARRMVSTLQSLNYGVDKIHLIVNRYKKGGDIQLDDVERTLGRKVMFTVPNSYEAVSSSVNQGISIFKIAKNDPVTKALLKFVHDLAQVETQDSGWLSHLFGHAKRYAD